MSETMTAAEYRASAGKHNESESAKVRRLFLFHIKARKLPEPRCKTHPEGEVVFMQGEVVERHTKRRKLKRRGKSPEWAFDFAWPEQRIAVEVEGVSVVRAGPMFLIGGRHGTIDGFKEDCEKYAWAAVMGWRVLRFEQSQVKAGLASDMLVRMFAALEAMPQPLVLSIADIERAAGRNNRELERLNQQYTDELTFGNAKQPDPF